MLLSNLLLTRERRLSFTVEEEIRLLRLTYSTFDYVENASIVTLQTSLFLSCAEVEFQNVRSSWLLLRESIMLAEELGFYTASTFYTNLS